MYYSTDATTWEQSFSELHEPLVQMYPDGHV